MSLIEYRSKQRGQTKITFMKRQIKWKRDLLCENLEKQITQFADDTSCTVLDWRSIKLIFNRLNIFSKYSGLTTNLDKSKFYDQDHGKGKTFPRGYNLKVLSDNLDVLRLNIGVNRERSDKNIFMKDR